MDDIISRLSSTDIDDLYDVLIDIGKGGLKEYKKEVVSFLEHKDPDVRRAAVMTLGTYWKDEDFIKRTETIALNDSDVLVRSSALMAWFFYYENTKDRTVLQKLSTLLKERVDKPIFLAEVYRGIYIVKGEPMNTEVFRALERAEDIDSLRKLVPWNEINV